jgi:RNA polymerase sigma-70 factor, ECF subfamily
MPAENAVSSDQQVIAAFRARDESTIRAVYEQQLPIMRRMARNYVRSDAMAEDVVQETWLAVVTGIDRFQGRAALSTWMYSILINQAKTHSVRENRMLPFSAMGAGDAEEPAVDAERFQGDSDASPGHWATPPRPWHKPERRLLSLETREQLRRALAELPERQRVIVALRDVEGVPAEEVCRRLSLSPENQRVLLHRGRSRLRAALEEYFDESCCNGSAVPPDRGRC